MHDVEWHWMSNFLYLIHEKQYLTLNKPKTTIILMLRRMSSLLLQLFVETIVSWDVLLLQEEYC